MTFELRPYQKEALKAIAEAEIAGIKRQLVVLPTGAGKTVVFSHLPEYRKESLPMLVLAHREELLHQAKDKILKTNPNLKVGIEKAELEAEDGCDVVVASVATLGRANSARISRFEPEYFKTIVVDEAHHAAAPSYGKILDYFQPDLVVGVTATPQRSDNVRLTDRFDEVVYYSSIKDLTEDGYLARLRGFRVDSSVDISGVSVRGGDYAEGELSAAINIEERNDLIVQAYRELATDRKAIVFCSTVQHAQDLATTFDSAGVTAECVVGTTESSERVSIYEGFKSGRTKVLTSVGVLCLDSKTEILTNKGWTTKDQMTYQHKVANWDWDGSIFFEEPKHIVRRARKPNEKMISVSSKYGDIRVTEDHRMLFSNTDSNFEIVHAKNLCGVSGYLPISGQAKPKVFTHQDMPVSSLPKSDIKRRIEANSYNLRKKGFSFEDSKLEAQKRIELRDSLKYKLPNELSLDQCKFIGFWLGDGTKTYLQSGGVEYVISQSTVYPKIIEKLDILFDEIGYDVIRKDNSHYTNSHIKWSFCRGTGFDSQKRNGLFELEPYLNKDGSKYLWGLNEEQFDALLEGFWLADGNHGTDPDDVTSFEIYNGSYLLLNTLQAIAVCRGYRATLRTKRQSNSKYKDLNVLSFRKQTSRKMVKDTLTEEENWNDEDVWCVTSTTGNIITRRNGHVTITGNTEGFDEPSVDCIILARPTRSNLLYTQIAGRGLRLHPGKENCLVIDIADVTKGKKPLGLPSLMGLPPDFDLGGEDLIETTEKFESLLAKSPTEASKVTSLDDIELAWKQIDIFAPPKPNQTVLEYSTFIWSEVGENNFYLNVDKLESVHLFTDALGRVHVSHENDMDKTTLSIQNDLRSGFAYADKWVKENKSDKVKLIDASAVWRNDPPTEKQIKWLKKFGVPITTDLTRGAASMILDGLFKSNPKPKRSPQQQWAINKAKMNKKDYF